MTYEINIDLTGVLLLAAVPFLLVCAVYMIVGVFNGPRTGGFTMRLTYGWLFLALPSVLAGLYGIIRVLGGM